MARNSDRVEEMERLVLELADGGVRVDARLLDRARALAATIRAERAARDAHRREVDRARQSRHRSRDKDRDSHAPSNVTDSVTSRVTERDSHAESSVTETPQDRLSEEEERGDLSRKPSGSLGELKKTAPPSYAPASEAVSRENERDRPGLRRAAAIAMRAAALDAAGQTRRDLVEQLERAERRRDDTERTWEEREKGRQQAERITHQIREHDAQQRAQEAATA